MLQLVPVPLHRTAEEFSGVSRFSIAGRPELQEDTSSVRQGLPALVNSQAVPGPSIRLVVVLQALGAPVRRADVPASVRGQDSAVLVQVDSAVLAPAVQALCHLRAKLLVRSGQQDALAVATSSIRRPKKAQ